MKIYYEELMQELDLNERIPDQHFFALNKSFEEICQDAKFTAALAERLLHEQKQPFYLLPFDHTLEAECFGAEIHFDSRLGSRILETPYKNLESLRRLTEIDFTVHRLKAVLEAVVMLKNRGNPICFNITGPVSVLEQLAGSGLFFESLRQPEILQEVLSVVEKGITDLLTKVIDINIDVLSYADPTGDRSIFGPWVFDKYFGASNYRVLKIVKEKLFESGTVFHVHPALAASFLKNDWMNVERTFLPERSYPESILEMKAQFPEAIFISRLKEESLIQLTFEK